MSYFEWLNNLEREESKLLRAQVVKLKSDRESLRTRVATSDACYEALTQDFQNERKKVDALAEKLLDRGYIIEQLENQIHNAVDALRLRHDPA